MELLLGVLLWGAVVALLLGWRARSRPSDPHRDAAPPRSVSAAPSAPRNGPPSGPPNGPPSAPQPTLTREDQRRREDDALVDGLVIGHFLTRDHNRRQAEELIARIDELADERDHWRELADTGMDEGDHLDTGFDDLDAGAHDLDGAGIVDGFGSTDDLDLLDDPDGLDHAEFDAMAGFGVEPWADDLFDLDDED